MISIPMATYRGYNYLKYVSIPSILSQDYTDWELHVVGDGTDDGSEDAIGEFNDRRITYENYSIPWYRDNNFVGFGSKYWNIAGVNALNRALGKCKGKYILRIDQDDLWEKTHIGNIVTYLDTNIEVDVAYTTARIYTNDIFGGRDGFYLGTNFDYDRLVKHNSNFINHSSIGWRVNEKTEHMMYSDNNDGGPADFQMWKSMAIKGCVFKWIPTLDVLYLNKCSIEFSSNFLK